MCTNRGSGPEASQTLQETVILIAMNSSVRQTDRNEWRGSLVVLYDWGESPSFRSDLGGMSNKCRNYVSADKKLRLKYNFDMHSPL